jgi:hypothetical protein
LGTGSISTGPRVDWPNHDGHLTERRRIPNLCDGLRTFSETANCTRVLRSCLQVPPNEMCAATVAVLVAMNEREEPLPTPNKPLLVTSKRLGSGRDAQGRNGDWSTVRPACERARLHLQLDMDVFNRVS